MSSNSCLLNFHRLRVEAKLTRHPGMTHLGYLLIQPNQDKSTARAWVPDMFCNLYLVKSHKIAYSSATTEVRVKIRTVLESTEFC